MTADLQPMREWLAAHPSSDDEIIAYSEGAVREVDGRKVTTMGHYDYRPAVHPFWRALEAAGWDYAQTRDYDVVVAQWRAENGVEQWNVHDLARMSRHTLFNVLRWYDRGERFCDGLWASAWKQGIFHAAARALIASS